MNGRLMYDYRILTTRILEKCGSFAEFARRMKISERNLHRKISNQISFTAKDVENAVTVLGLNRSEISDIFFTLISPKNADFFLGET